MQITTGQTYKTRCGDQVVIVARIPAKIYPWLGYRVGDCRIMTFHDDGRATNLPVSDDDLDGEFTGGEGHLCIYDYGDPHPLGHDLMISGSQDAIRKDYNPGKLLGRYHIATVRVSWERGKHEV